MTATVALEGFSLCPARSRPAGPITVAVIPMPPPSFCATTVTPTPLPSSPGHYRHCCATAVITMPPVTTFITVPLLSLLCHGHHHHATAVIAVPPLSSPCHCRLCQPGTGYWPNPLGRVGGSGFLLCKPALQALAGFWGPGRNGLSPGVSGWAVGAGTS